MCSINLGLYWNVNLLPPVYQSSETKAMSIKGSLSTSDCYSKLKNIHRE